MLSTHIREKGFTLVELLTVIVIIGILAAVAVPVFTAQRSRAQDAKVISDVKNIVVAAETWLSDAQNNPINLTPSSIANDVVTSPGTKWGLSANSITNGYCIVAGNTQSKSFNTELKLLTYDSTGGGLYKSSSSCSGISRPNPEFGVGSDVVSLGASNMYRWDGTVSGAINANVPFLNANRTIVDYIIGSGGYLIVSTSDGKVFRWDGVSSSYVDITPSVLNNTAKITSLIKYTNGYIYFATNTGRAYSWNETVNGATEVTPEFLSNGTYYNFSVLSNNGYLYAATSNGRLYRWDGSVTGYSNITPNFLDGSRYVTMLINDPPNGYLYVGTSDGGLYRGDGSVTGWTKITNNFLSNSTYLTSGIYSNNGYIYFGTNDGKTLRWSRGSTADDVTPSVVNSSHQMIDALLFTSGYMYISVK